MAAAALLFGDGGEVGGVLLIVGFLVIAGLGALLGLAQVYAFLLGMMRLLYLTAVTFDMCRPFFAFQTTMLALCDRSALLGDQRQFAVSVRAAAHAVAL